MHYFSLLLAINVSVLFVTAAVPATAQLDPLSSGACKAVGINCEAEADANTLADFAIFVINALLIFVGLGALVALIWGGVKYIISLGDQDEVAKAKRIILYALVGVIVVGLAAAIVNFTIGVIGTGTGSG